MQIEPETITQTAPDEAARKRVWLNGQLVPADQAAVSVLDHGVLYGDGVFEGIRVYNGRVFKLHSHLNRLSESARSIRLELPYSIAEIEAAVRETVRVNGLTDGYIRLNVTRGVGSLGINPFSCPRAGVCIIAGSINMYPQELYDNGMAVITSSFIRNHASAVSPRIKCLSYMNNVLAKIEAIDAGVMEAVMLNHQGYVAECTGDNLFIVKARKSGRAIYTPPLHAGILEGITRDTVIGLAHQAGHEAIEADLTKHDLYTADEMFLTGTAAEVIPVTRVDERVIGAGKPGPVTCELIGAFRKLVENNAPEN